MLAVEIRMEERQLYGVPDLFDLRTEASDVLVGDIGHLVEDQVGEAAAKLVQRTRAHTDLPSCVGLGVRSQQQAARRHACVVAARWAADMCGQ